MFDNLVKEEHYLCTNYLSRFCIVYDYKRKIFQDKGTFEKDCMLLISFVKWPLYMVCLTIENLKGVIKNHQKDLKTPKINPTFKCFSSDL